MPASPTVDLLAVMAKFSRGSDWARSCGAEVARRRQVRGLSVADLAALCGTTQPTITRVEQGYSVPSDPMRAVIAYHLGVRPETLWKFPSSEVLESS